MHIAIGVIQYIHIQSSLPNAKSHKSNNHLKVKVLFDSPLFSIIVFDPS